ncbi:jacalin-like lectin domain-containing protein [Artemisia annua]|uniref:Jacalin-like lectin domain-containing protein n=1 Tax=Artemisia annua TaxID=35608 RepID=A0A2U1NU68_ARTAN|nr:jacalin-like lectin domain-containing protein [Artemisia annua]
MSRIPELNHLQLPLNDIMSATNNFSERNYVGRGGFGRVYKGQLQPSGITVAVKRLDRRFGQGENEFLKEILMLASYKHENLVSLVGFCDQGQEKILVYKHEDNGSLNKHLASTNLTWEQRLRICVGAARGLDYLHNGVGEGHRVVHRDIKSSNILLDANWKAKISDFGLSKFAPKNQQFSFLVTNACGTMGYVDPCYTKTGVLTKESDVYSFGIVLFEVLCGRLAMVCEYEDERRFLSSWVKLNDKNKKLQQISIPFLQEQMKPKSISIFFKIALQCLNNKSQQRPTMRKIVKELETALEAQLPTSSSELSLIHSSPTEPAIATAAMATPIIHITAATHFPIKLTPQNFPSWRTQVTATLIGLELDHHIIGTAKIPAETVPDGQNTKPNPEYLRWFRQDQMVISALLGSCSDQIQPIISSAKTAREAWELLNSSYASSSRSRIISLKSRLAKNPKGTRSISEYLHEMKSIFDELALTQSPIPEEDLVIHVMNQLGDDYASLVASFKTRDTTIAFPDLFEKLLDHERTLKENQALTEPSLTTPNSQPIQ